MDGTRLEPEERWLSDDAARRYSGERWSSRRRRERDPRLVAAILAQLLGGRRALVLDVPCGTARLRSAIEGHARWCGLDVSPAMLASARMLDPSALFRGDAARLPFRDASFDAVVCCRLLHHLHEEAALERVLGELVRVTREHLVASFWDAASLPEWRRRTLRPARPARRYARTKEDLARLLEASGARVLEWRHSARFFSRQAFVVARKERP